MISGRFGDEDELIFEIELITFDGLELPIDAVLDTGFSDWLAIDKQDLEGFDWEYLGERNMLMARGESRFDIYAGKVKIDGEIFDVPVYAGDGVPEVLLGRQWLKTRRLVVDMSSGVLTLGD
ncbi:MAG: aspartyl protease [Calothrix sp. MO_192.B10]|nr:aspartyl protease [Calothrix sp. MO_192.B10]